MFKFDQEKYWQKYNEVEMERSAGLKFNMSFKEALDHFFRNEPGKRRMFLIKDLLDKEEKAGKIAKKITNILEVGLDFFKDKKILDVGTGSGGAAVFFSKAGADVIGIDTNEGFLKLARIRARENDLKLDFMAGDATNSGFKDNCFDFLFADQVIEHVKDVDGLFKEAHRILKPGGHLFMQFPNKWQIREVHCDGLFFVSFLPNALATFYLCLRKKRKWELVFLPWGVWHKWPSTIFRLLEKNGFSIIYKDYPPLIGDLEADAAQKYKNRKFMQNRFSAAIFKALYYLKELLKRSQSNVNVMALKR